MRWSNIIAGLLVVLSCGLGYADTKISAMSSTSTLNAGDIVPVVTNPGSSPANFSITKTNLNNTLNSWTTPKQSTFTYGLTVGSLTVTNSATVTYGVSAGSVTASSITTSGQLTADSILANASIGIGRLPTMGRLLDIAGSMGLDGAITSLSFVQATALRQQSSNAGNPAIAIIDASGTGNFGEMENDSKNVWDIGYTNSASNPGTPVIVWNTSPVVNIKSSMTVEGAGGLNVTFGVIASSVAASSMTASGQITAGSLLLNTPLPVAGGGTGTASPGLVPGTNITSITGTWPNQTINAATQSGGGGGSSAMAVTIGVSRTSPTSDMTFNPNQFTGGVVGSSMTIDVNVANILPSTIAYRTTSNVFTSSQTVTSSMTILGIGGLNVTYGVSAGSYTGAGLGTCGSSSQAESYTSSNTFACTTITAAGIGALTGNQTVTLTGDVSGSGATSIATTANALQNNITTFGSSITFKSETLIKSTATILSNSAALYDLFIATNPAGTVGTTTHLSVSTGGAVVANGPGGLTVGFGVNASTFVGNGAGLTSLTGSNVASGVPSSVLPSTVAYLISTNTWSGYQNFTSSITTAGAIYVSSTIVLSGSPGANGNVLTSGGNGAVPTWTSAGAGTITGVQGGPGLTGGGTSGSVTLQAASTAAFTTSSNTWTAYQNFTSSITQAGGIYISSTVLLSGAPGSAGQFLTTGGNGTVPTWTTPSAGTGDMILASTQTVTGRKIFPSSTTFQGSVDISSTIILSGTPGASGSLLTSAGNGSVPTWTATSALTNLTGANIASAIPSAVLPSTVDFITSSQTVTAYKNWTSSVTHSGAVYISSTVALNGSPGSNGQVLTSGGNGATPSWTNVSGGGYTTVQDEASNLTQRATLNFTGAGVACVDNAGSSRTDCTIGGGLAAPLSFPMTYQAAICVSSSSSLGFNAFSSSAPVTECIISSSTVFGTAGFVDGSTNAVQSSFWLPTDWTGNIDIYWIWQSSATTGNAAWQARTGCQTSGETAVGWNVFSSSITTTQATANMDEQNKLTALDVTSCTAGDMFTFELLRSGTIGTDTLLPYARLKNVLVVYRRNMTL